jgi:hypothetical protein
MARLSWPLARRLSGVALPLLFVLFAAPSRAHASCGDYVQVYRPAHATGDVPHPQPSHPSLPLPGFPCDGPNCSKGDPTPSMPAPVVPVVLRDPWACLTQVVPPGAPDGERVHAPAALLLPARRLDSVYRPPRS